jgi:hypothetical protein
MCLHAACFCAHMHALCVVAPPQGHGSLALEDGSGGGPGCTVCGGTGRVLRTVWRASGVKSTQLGECPACAGSGIAVHSGCRR